MNIQHLRIMLFLEWRLWFSLRPILNFRSTMSHRHFHPLINIIKSESEPVCLHDFIWNFTHHTIICVCMVSCFMLAWHKSMSICEIGLKFTSRFNKKIDSNASKETCGTSIKIFTQRYIWSINWLKYKKVNMGRVESRYNISWKNMYVKNYRL